VITQKEAQKAVWTLRFTKFFRLSVADRQSHPAWGEPKGMCEEGRLLYRFFCENPWINREFHEHIHAEKEGCMKCRAAYLRFVTRVTS
jgi:hypothetical protein